MLVLKDLLLRFLTAIGVWVTGFFAGKSNAQKKEAVQKAREAHEDAKKWANRPRNDSDAVKRLRNASKKRKR